ncbi:DegT/DnrJ/EryC1/StrS family aminotransferase [Streptomyces sp. NBC_01264]|uniref:DegT/DnrJ/EryC1/StrS family aminotransferase n=1 Tax=Streptomyces sp. NBC_01264 TaxID=2903804 RepID=UPI002258DCAB|nr:DegT/DnrJ/EryC1/StrS family aminotransferase [Streptomyces sp. NBC_01264]MCX4782724.1 DegT/DnrJ/EryC1/StrS family aminotransferase [Streptomyces sp. NBC_01264]
MNTLTAGTIAGEFHARRVRALKADVLRLVEEVIDDGVFHGGRRVRELEAVAGERWRGHAVAASSGTMALECAVRALGIGTGDEVIMPALTFVSTAFAVAAAGAVPVFVDIDPHTRTINPAAAAAAVTPRTRAVIPVHMHGLMADMTAITALADRHGLAVIEDCAQAAGATDAGRPAGSVGDIGCYSMWVGKNLGGLADSGLLLARDPALVPLLRKLTDLGRDGERNTHHLRGSRARMGEIDAAVIRHQLDLLPAWTERRRTLAARYADAFATLPVGAPHDAEHRPHTYYKYPLTLPDPATAAALMTHLSRAGITTEQVYPHAVPHQPALRDITHRTTDITVTLDLLPRMVCLPLAPELTDEETDRVIDAVHAFHTDRA